MIRFAPSPSPDLTPCPSPQERGVLVSVKIIVCFTLIVLLFNCGENGTDISTDDGNMNATQVAADTCDCVDLVADSTGTNLLEGKLFTGMCISYYQNTEDKYIEKNLLEGKLHGKVTYYDKTGGLLFEEIYENGKQKRNGLLDETLKCDCTELIHVKTSDPLYPSIAKLDDIPFSGKCEKFYENSTQLYMESEYKNGLLDGHTIYYREDGSTILIEKYSNGEMVSTVN